MKKVTKRFLSVINRFLLPKVELCCTPKIPSKLRYPAVFFIGAPRSGTTLTMQVIVSVFDLGYISNRHHMFYGAPGVLERFIQTRTQVRSSFTSDYGFTKGLHEPHECGVWWYRFFRKQPRYVDMSGVEHKKMLRFRRSIASMVNAFNKPVIFKNPHAALRIQPIFHFIPEALFIRVTRNEIDNGHSLLEARFKKNGNYNDWWSMEPPAFDDLKDLEPHIQVIEQIRNINSTIKRDLEVAEVPSDRVFDIDYESLCSNPSLEMGRLEAFFAGHGVEVQRIASPPKPFQMRDEVRIDDELYESMIRYASKH